MSIPSGLPIVRTTSVTLVDRQEKKGHVKLGNVETMKREYEDPRYMKQSGSGESGIQETGFISLKYIPSCSEKDLNRKDVMGGVQYDPF